MGVYDYIFTDFLTDKFFGFGFIDKFKRDGALIHYSAFLDFIVGIEFHKVADYHVVGAYFLCIRHFAVATGDAIYLLVDHFVVDEQGIVRKFIFGSDFHVKVGCKTEFVYKFKVIGIVPVALILMIFAGNGASEHFQVIFGNVALDFFIEHFIEFFGEN